VHSERYLVTHKSLPVSRHIDHAYNIARRTGVPPVIYFNQDHTKDVFGAFKNYNTIVSRSTFITLRINFAMRNSCPDPKSEILIKDSSLLSDRVQKGRNDNKMDCDKVSGGAGGGIKANKSRNYSPLAELKNVSPSGGGAEVDLLCKIPLNLPLRKGDLMEPLIFLLYGFYCRQYE